MTEGKVNIVVADDHRLFRVGMSALLSDFEHVGEIYEASNGKELLKLLGKLEAKPDLVLLDINMPEMDGVEATKQIKLLYPEIRILILSMEDDSQLVSLLVDEGVNGYLLKNSDPDELELAIKLVTKNDFYFSTALSSKLMQALKTNTRKREVKEMFTEKEIQVLQLVCQELTAAEIGERMFLSERTIEGYRRRLLEKTEARNIAGMVVFAIKNGLYSIGE